MANIEKKKLSNSVLPMSLVLDLCIKTNPNTNIFRGMNSTNRKIRNNLYLGLAHKRREQNILE